MIAYFGAYAHFQLTTLNDELYHALGMPFDTQCLCDVRSVSGLSFQAQDVRFVSLEQDSQNTFSVVSLSVKSTIFPVFDLFCQYVHADVDRH